MSTRNALCTCGSGKKSKRCCQSEVLKSEQRREAKRIAIERMNERTSSSDRSFSLMTLAALSAFGHLNQK